MRAVERPHDTERMVREYGPSLLAYLRRYIGDPTAAEDLLQETWIRMSRGLDGFAGHSSVKTWLFAIASRVAADHLRRSKNRLRVVDLDEAVEVSDPAPEIGDRLMAEETSTCVRQVIDSLPDAYRSTLLLHDLQDLSLEQTAEASGSTPGATKIRLHRARQRLKAALDRQCDFYEGAEGALRCDRRPADDQ